MPAAPDVSINGFYIPITGKSKPSIGNYLVSAPIITNYFMHLRAPWQLQNCQSGSFSGPAGGVRYCDQVAEISRALVGRNSPALGLKSPV
jgi:hypothetical protein